MTGLKNINKNLVIIENKTKQKRNNNGTIIDL